ncbi:unnamed protein product [Allacma fusca]|uniref:Uncharacterized protein n=1 Tax=Allacma fusca TaxID=39272 RepID=A0A8J2J7U8_9HEXA|nr:unnamed protein product [Allacma fusca]
MIHHDTAKVIIIDKMPSCRFGRRSQCQGQRFAHPVFSFVETSPTEESSNESDTESFWSQLIDMLDEGILEFTRQMSLKEQEPKKESPQEKCGLRRNSIDPVNTFIEAPLPVPEKPAKPQAIEIPVNVEKVESSPVKKNAEVDIEFPTEASD